MTKFEIEEQTFTEKVKRYTIVWPDGMLDSTDFKEKVDAEMFKKALEEAYKQGYKDGSRKP